MSQRQPKTSPNHTRSFYIVWSGQLVSAIGSHMSHFAISIWVWEQTQQATALALVALFTQMPRVLVSPLAGGLVDRWHRKTLILLGDTVAALSVVALLLLYLMGSLQVWHFFFAGAVNGTFSQLQQLAYTASISQLVPEGQYTRAGGMSSVLHYGSVILAPALAGSLYEPVGLAGIFAADLGTFVFAVATVVAATIPSPRGTPQESKHKASKTNFWHHIILGFRYVFANPSLLALLGAMALFQLIHDIGKGLYSPMILARSGGDAQVLGTVAAAAGIGGILGSVLVGVWGGPKRKIHGFLLGMVGAGLSKIVFGLGRSPMVWVPAQFLSSVHFPTIHSTRQSILFAQVDANFQGRVFSIGFLIVGAIPPFGKLLAGVIADRFLEPAMMPGGWLAGVFGGIFGVGAGSGMALLYTISSIGLVLVGLAGYAWKPLRNVEFWTPKTVEQVTGNEP